MLVSTFWRSAGSSVFDFLNMNGLDGSAMASLVSQAIALYPIVTVEATTLMAPCDQQDNSFICESYQPQPAGGIVKIATGVSRMAVWHSRTRIGGCNEEMIHT